MKELKPTSLGTHAAIGLSMVLLAPTHHEPLRAKISFKRRQ